MRAAILPVLVCAACLVAAGCGDDYRGPPYDPIPGCDPDPPPSTGDPYQDCVDRINQLRAECQELPPLERWYEGEACADMHAQYDADLDVPHQGIRDGICQPSGMSQNECTGWRSAEEAIDRCFQIMWDEGPGQPFEEHGHYLNMSSTTFTKVACGFANLGTDDVWVVQNYE